MSFQRDTVSNVRIKNRDEVYHLVQRHPLNVSRREIVQLFDLARMDPRLMEIMTEFLRDFWWTLDPQELNQAARKARFPFMMKAALILILENCKIDITNKSDFFAWFQKAIRGIKDPAPQLLYVGVFPIGSKALRDQVDHALPELFKHNIILKDLPFNKGKPGILKSRNNPPANRIDKLDHLKIEYVEKIKEFKRNKNLKNRELISLTGINRVFLSRILNNKFEKISVEYLKEKADALLVEC